MTRPTGTFPTLRRGSLHLLGLQGWPRGPGPGPHCMLPDQVHGGQHATRAKPRVHSPKATSGSTSLVTSSFLRSHPCSTQSGGRGVEETSADALQLQVSTSGTRVCPDRGQTHSVPTTEQSRTCAWSKMLGFQYPRQGVPSNSATRTHGSREARAATRTRPVPAQCLALSHDDALRDQQIFSARQKQNRPGGKAGTCNKPLR